MASQAGSRLIWRLAAGSRLGNPCGILRLWWWWEAIFLRVRATRPIPDAPHGIFLLRLVRYRGCPLHLPDGTCVRPGDRVIQLHLNNSVVPRAAVQSTWHVVRVMREDLRALARWIAEREPEPDGLEAAGGLPALYGFTLLARAGTRLGFTVREQPITLRARLVGFYMRGLLMLYSREGLERLTRGSGATDAPREIWMSRHELLRRYAGS